MGNVTEKTVFGTDSQNAMIREHLESGKSLTSLEALDKFHCFRLASRIADLKKSGMEITTTMVTAANGRRYAKYSI